MHFTMVMCSVVLFLVANYFNDDNSYTTNQIISQPKTLFDGVVGGGWGRVEERSVSSKVKLQSWQIGKLICCFVLELEFLIDIHQCNYLPSNS